MYFGLVVLGFQVRTSEYEGLSKGVVGSAEKAPQALSRGFTTLYRFYQLVQEINARYSKDFKCIISLPF